MTVTNLGRLESVELRDILTPGIDLELEAQKRRQH
jgi:hypothetical protein